MLPFWDPIAIMSPTEQVNRFECLDHLDHCNRMHKHATYLD